ncbi:DUF4262 domain-containing protein [Verrucomicrobium spinosum]|uniref:DUF4262 domain-containing protein n=1 Tax=Verrucomicrobium spinosum TaxID=2736 RepID=UPI0001746996|nr:DUF4262 domain-containing protein [Verrucomicrobium spinosum]
MQSNPVKPRLSPFTFPKPEDPPDKVVLRDIKRHGWHLMHIGPEGDLPQFAFSIGFYYQFLQPEVLVMGLGVEKSANLLNHIGETLLSGKVLSPGRDAEYMAGYPVEFRPVHIAHYREHLGYAIWFYRSLPQAFPAMQCLLPDKAGKFPGDEGYDIRYDALQKNLSVG